MNIWQKIGSQIKSKRQQRGLTQGQLGAKVGARKAFISNIENCNQKCSLEKLNEIADALNCELDVVVRER
jgi:transcriptional regulator with XRE-family HTH domain